MRLLMTKYDTMTNKDFKEKYFAEKGIRWYDNWVDYANWLEDALIEALHQPPVMVRSEQLPCSHCGRPLKEHSKASKLCPDRMKNFEQGN